MSEIILFFQTLFDGVWGLYSITWPGFNFTFGQAILACLLSAAALNIILGMIGVSLLPPILHPHEQRGGNSKNITIPKERKYDEK